MVKTVIRGEDRLSGPMDRIGAATKRTSKRFSALGLAGGALTQTLGVLGVAGGFGMIIKRAAAMDDALGNLASVTTLAGTGFVSMDAAMQASQKSATSWASQHRQSAEDVVKAQYNLASAGLDAQQAIDASIPSISLAAATYADAELATQVMGTSLNTFGKSQMAAMDTQERATRIMDTYAYVVKAMQTTLPGLWGAMKTAGGAANSMGVSFEEAVGSVGLLQTLGMSDERAGTGFAAFLRTMPKAAKAFGVQIEDKVTGRLRPIADIVDDLTKRTAKYSAVQRQIKIQKIMGDEGARATVLLLGQAEALRKVAAEATQAGTAMDMLTEQEKGSGAQLAILKNNLDNLATAFGQGLGPAITPLVKSLAEGLRDLQPLAESTGRHVEQVIALSRRAGSAVYDAMHDKQIAGRIALGMAGGGGMTALTHGLPTKTTMGKELLREVPVNGHIRLEVVTQKGVTATVADANINNGKVATSVRTGRRRIGGD